MAQKKILFISADGVPQEHDSSTDEITFLTGQFGNVLASGNSVVSTDTNGDLALTPNGTGDLVLDGLNWPQADGSSGQFLQTDGAGQLSWANQTDDVQAENVGNEYTADGAIAICDGVYISGSGLVAPAIADNTAASHLVGFAEAAAADTAPVIVVSEGVLGGFTGLTAGSRYYLDDTTAGAIVSTPPSASAKTVVQAGYAKSATELHIHIEQMGRRA